MADPDEGVAADGTIRTGARRDRVPAAIEPVLAARLAQLHSWAKAERRSGREEVRHALADDGIVAAIVDRFGHLIGLWTGDPG